VTVSRSSAADSAVGSVAPGGVVCLSAGSYAGLDFAGGRAGDVTVQPVPGQRVTVSAGVKDSHGSTVAVLFEPNTSHIILHGFYITAEVELEQGVSSVRIDHNDITGGWEGVELSSVDCTVPNAPTWSGCYPAPKISNVVISGNRIHNIGGTTGDDALNINNYSNVRITGNELFGMLEAGNHTDCLQSTFGGSGLVFDHNYEHDNNCQGFFTKDGDVTDAVVYDNLFVRDQAANKPEGNMDIWNVYNLTIRSNTSWPSTIDLLRDINSARQPHAAVDHNVFDTFSNGCCGDAKYFALTESFNIFGQAPAFGTAATDATGAPTFVSPTTDDYRLLRNPHGIGIDWRPADQHYGP
jgi:hypothetical protein